MKPTINLEFKPNTGNYHVASTKNTLKYTPGDYIRRKDVEQLIQTKKFTVNIKKAKA